MENKINRITDILRRDDGISGAMMYTEQISWILFLKLEDSKVMRHFLMGRVILTSINVVEIILYLILLINMLIKMFYEEKLWLSQDFGYAEYSKKTYRLIPFLF